MSEVGVVKSSRIGIGYRSKKQVVLLSVEISDPKDVQEIEYISHGGDTSIPVVGNTVIIHEVSSQYKVATMENTGVIVAGLSMGDRSIYAVKDGVVGGIIKYLSSGELVLNNGIGYAVEFGELKAGFDTLVANYNAHTHGSQPVPTPTTASIDGAKVDLVRI